MYTNEITNEMGVDYSDLVRMRQERQECAAQGHW